MLSSPARLFASAAAEVAVFESAATATAAVPAAARATEAPFGLGSRFIHHERASLQLMLVKLADRNHAAASTTSPLICFARRARRMKTAWVTSSAIAASAV